MTLLQTYIFLGMLVWVLLICFAPWWLAKAVIGFTAFVFFVVFMNLIFK